MTCADGYFFWPSKPGVDYSALEETIVRISGKGAIASFSPSGYGLSSGHDFLNQSLFNDLFNNNQTQLGYISTHAKYSLYANTTAYRDLIDTYLLFGDPAVKLQVLPLPAPTAPINLQAEVVSNAQINLTWQADSKGKSEFRIERSLDGSTGWTQVAVVNNSVTAYSDALLNCETPYHYRVRAYRSGDDLYSAYSNTANAATFACQSFFLPLVEN
jgi:hypothetical protein